LGNSEKSHHKINMLYAFGGNQEKARAKMRATLESLMKRAPLANVMRVTDEDIEDISIDELLASQGLFYNKRIVVFDNAFKEKDVRKKTSARFKEIAESPHVFLILEEKHDAEFEKRLGKYATKREVIGTDEEKKKKAADFSAANALERRDAKSLWLAIVKSSLEGTAPEMMYGQLFWKAKQMLLTKRTSAYSEKELRELIVSLVELPHKSRRRGTEMRYALESFALKIR